MSHREDGFCFFNGAHKAMEDGADAVCFLLFLIAALIA